MTSRVCSECQWWLKDPDGNAWGDCRGAPPMISPLGQKLWPWTDPDDWCGMFRLRLKAIDGHDVRQA